MEKGRRKNVIHVRLTDSELQKLNKKVRDSGMKSREDFCRVCFENVEIRASPPKEFYVLITEVRRVGNNLNQIARRLNCYMNGDIPDKDEVNTAIKEVRGAVDMLYTGYTSKEV